MRWQDDLDRQLDERLEREDEVDRKKGIDPNPISLKLFDENMELMVLISGTGSKEINGSSITIVGEFLRDHAEVLKSASFCEVHQFRNERRYLGEVSDWSGATLKITNCKKSDGFGQF